jgi:hypothetical protein
VSCTRTYQLLVNLTESLDSLRNQSSDVFVPPMTTPIRMFEIAINRALKAQVKVIKAKAISNANLYKVS